MPYFYFSALFFVGIHAEEFPDLLVLYAGYKALQGSRPAQAVLAFAGTYYCNDQANFHAQQARWISNRYPDIQDHHAQMSLAWGLGSLACLGTCIYLLNKTDENKQKPANDKQALAIE